MSNKTFLTIHSAIYASFAIALFFVPALLWPLYGVSVSDPNAYFLSQHNSIFLGGLAVISFQFRDIESDNLKAGKLFKGLMWTNIFGLFITLYACITGTFTGFGWSDPAFFGLLAILSFRQLQKN